MKNANLLEIAIGNGTPLLKFVALCLILAGFFALFLAATGQFLPHDIAYLGLTASELCTFYDCRIVDFMIHDRTAFGGALVAVGLLYLWLTALPLRHGQAWAWWTLTLSGIAGFTSFLAYLGYGYLDTWHGFATLILIPIYTLGLIKSRSLIQGSKSIQVLRRPSVPLSLRSPAGTGRVLLLLVTTGMIISGFIVLTIGSSEIFVPQDLIFMQVTINDLTNLNTRLISLIAHDRAGFGGAIFSIGIAAFIAIWCAEPAKHLWQILLLAGGMGFGCAIGTHFFVGYLDFIHLAPAYLGAGLFALGLVLTYPTMVK